MFRQAKLFVIASMNSTGWCYMEYGIRNMGKHPKIHVHTHVCQVQLLGLELSE